MRVAFLFAHDQIHQVAHSLPIAIALAKSSLPVEIIVATANDRVAKEVVRLGAGWLGADIEHVTLSLSSASARLSRLLDSIVPAKKVLIYRDNLDFFRSLDVLVVTEKTSLILKSHYGLNNLYMIHTRHGAGDRAIGFDRASAHFDHVLCSGEKIRRRLVAEAHVDPDTISVIGYPKFDLLKPIEQRQEEKHERSVVLYNPHPSPHLSSWYKHGRKVLDYFCHCDDRKLIFAPHVMLFERSFVATIDRLTAKRPGKIESRYLQNDNIHIDLGSQASTDLSYTMVADIYLGDVSSQVYEFLIRPRPCIFLNSHGKHWQDDPDFTHWHAGEVISDPAELGAALGRCERLHDEHYRAVQERMLAETFDLNERPSSERAAEVIASIVERLRMNVAVSRGAGSTKTMQVSPLTNEITVEKP